MGQLGLIRSGEVSDYFVNVAFEVRSHQGLVGDRIGVVGDVEALGLWRLKEALQLKAVQHTGKHPITAPQHDAGRLFLCDLHLFIPLSCSTPASF